MQSTAVEAQVCCVMVLALDLVKVQVHDRDAG